MSVAKWYPKGKLNIYRGKIDLANHDIAVMLTDSSIAPDPAHELAGDILNEIAGPGYVAGGQLLQNKSLAIVGNRLVFDADDVVWTPATIKARYAHIYDKTAAPALLIGYIAADQDISSTNDDFKLQFPADGALYDQMIG